MDKADRADNGHKVHNPASPDKQVNRANPDKVNAPK